MKLIVLLATLALTMSAFACPGGKDKEEEKDGRITIIR